MGWLSTGNYNARVPADSRTFPESVNRIMTGIGIDGPDTVESPNKNTLLAMAACNDALERIWFAAKWDFKRVFATLELVNEQMFYDLPADWHEAAGNPSYFEGNIQKTLHFWEYERLLTYYPNLPFTGDSGDENLSTIGLTNTWFADDSTLGMRGVCDRWTIAADRIGLFPIPDASALDLGTSDPSWISHLRFAYYTTLARMTSDTDTIPLPPHMLLIHHMLAIGYLKQSLEYPDYRADESRGEALLRQAVARQLLKENRDIRIEVEGYSA